jgi:Uncharacterized conserved protein
VASAIVTVNSPAPQRTITVSGAGTLSPNADLAKISMGVHSAVAIAKAAAADNTTRTQRLIQALTVQMGIDAKDIRTLNYSVWAGTSPSDNVTPVYTVDNTVQVAVHKISRVGDALDAAVSAGADNISSISFEVADQTQALQQARALAVKDAREKAKELAAAAGVKLGEVVSISYADATTVYPLYSTAVMNASGRDASSVPVEPGNVDVTATVQVVYAIQ